MGQAEDVGAGGVRAALRVGVTGHRVIERSLVDDVAARVREVLRAAAERTAALSRDAGTGYAAGAPLLRVISPLAEGADRIVAREGLEAGWELQCPLPFAREEYAADFASTASKEEFDALLARSSAVLELDGLRAQSSLAYQNAGRVMLEQSDVLIAIWNGQSSESQGGTARMVFEAREQEIPVVWIHPERPGEILAGEGAVGGWQARLGEVIQGLLSAPEGGERERADLASFQRCLDRARPGGVLGRIWRGAAALLTWPQARSAQKAEEPSEPGPFDAAFAQANRAAMAYAERHRGAFVLNGLLGVFAVVNALLVVAAHDLHLVWVWMELGTICTILLLIFMARRGRWHQRAIDCRMYAEQLRQMRYLWPLGRVTPVTRPPGHHAFGDPRGTSANRHFRALVRLTGMCAGRFSPERAQACLDRIRKGWLAGQLAYHHGAAERYERIERRLHRAARALFVLTALACIAHLLVHDPRVAPWLTLLSATLPAAGAAAHAIAGHGEFRRLAERSEAMADGLARAHAAMGAPVDRLSQMSVFAAVEPAARAMMDEVTDWQILYRKPPLEPA